MVCQQHKLQAGTEATSKELLEIVAKPHHEKTTTIQELSCYQFEGLLTSGALLIKQITQIRYWLLKRAFQTFELLAIGLSVACTLFALTTKGYFKSVSKDPKLAICGDRYKC